MTDPALIIAIATLISALGAMVTAISALLVSLRNSRGIEQVHLATNSMKDELIAVTAKSSRALGVKEEKDRQELKSDGAS